jgi:hypothetical protein
MSFAPELLAALYHYAAVIEPTEGEVTDLDRAQELWQQAEAQRGERLVTLVGKARTMHANGDTVAAVKAYGRAREVMVQAGTSGDGLPFFEEVVEGSIALAAVESGSSKLHVYEWSSIASLIGAAIMLFAAHV